MRSARDTSERWRSCRASFLYESWVYGEVYGLGGRSGEGEGEQGGHEGAEYVREFVTGAG
jgi:hypothetical protein